MASSVADKKRRVARIGGSRSLNLEHILPSAAGGDADAGSLQAVERVGLLRIEPLADVSMRNALCWIAAIYSIPAFRMV